MPPLTCWSPLFFYSLLLSELWMPVLTVFPVWTVFNHQMRALWMYSDLSPMVIFLLVCLFFAFSFPLAPTASVYCVGHSCFWLDFFVHCLFLSCSVPVLQLWPPLCDVYDISDSAHLFLLYFWLSAVYLSALCLICVHAFLTCHAEDGGQTS